MTAPAMILMHTPTWAKVLLAIMLGALVMWGYGYCAERGRAEQRELKATSDSLAEMRPLLDSALKIASEHTDTVVRDRVIYTDRILAGNRSSIPRDEVVTLAGKCAEAENACALQRKAAQALIDNLKARVAVEQKRIAFMPPRLRLGVEGGWDFTRSEIPFRGRGELRIAGPISIVGEAELRFPTDTVRMENALRALIRYQFR